MEVDGYRIYYVEDVVTSDGLLSLVRNSSAEKLALVISENQIIFLENYNLGLLKKYLDRTEKEIVFVSNDEKIREKLAKVGFKVFSNLNKLEDHISYGEITDDYGKEKTKIAKRQRTFMMTAVVIIIFLAGIYFLYPTVIINIEPVTKIIDKEIVVQGSLAQDKISWEEKIIPLHRFEVELTGDEAIQATGLKTVGIKAARGRIKFINENKKEVIIPLGTIVMTDNGIKYKTLDEITVPPLKVDYLMDLPVGMRAGQAGVDIIALVKGEKGNVSIGKINKFLNKREDIYAINSEPVAGGIDEKVRVVAEDDIVNLKEKLTQEMKREILTKIYRKMGGNFRIIEDQIKFSDIIFKIDDQVGEKTDRLNGRGLLTASGYLLRNIELDKIVTGILKDKFDQDYRLLSSGVNIEEVELEKMTQKLYNIELKLKAAAVPNIKKMNLAERISGRSVEEAVEILNNNGYVDRFSITGERKKIPHLKYAIKINIADPGAVTVFNEMPGK